MVPRTTEGDANGGPIPYLKVLDVQEIRAPRERYES
jgi:hypothetical protein